LALFPTAVDAQGIMHSNTAFGDYPQFYPGIKKSLVNNNFSGWMLYPTRNMLKHHPHWKASSQKMPQMKIS
jgi:hypothetical protein